MHPDSLEDVLLSGLFRIHMDLNPAHEEVQHGREDKIEHGNSNPFQRTFTVHRIAFTALLTSQISTKKTVFDSFRHRIFRLCFSASELRSPAFPGKSVDCVRQLILSVKPVQSVHRNNGIQQS